VQSISAAYTCELANADANNNAVDKGLDKRVNFLTLFLINLLNFKGISPNFRVGCINTMSRTTKIENYKECPNLNSLN